LQSQMAHNLGICAVVTLITLVSMDKASKQPHNGQPWLG